MSDFIFFSMWLKEQGDSNQCERTLGGICSTEGIKYGINNCEYAPSVTSRPNTKGHNSRHCCLWRILLWMGSYSFIHPWNSLRHSEYSISHPNPNLVIAGELVLCKIFYQGADIYSKIPSGYRKHWILPCVYFNLCLGIILSAHKRPARTLQE